MYSLTLIAACRSVCLMSIHASIYSVHRGCFYIVPGETQGSGTIGWRHAPPREKLGEFVVLTKNWKDVNCNYQRFDWIHQKNNIIRYNNIHEIGTDLPGICQYLKARPAMQRRTHSLLFLLYLKIRGILLRQFVFHIVWKYTVRIGRCVLCCVAGLRYLSISPRKNWPTMQVVARSVDIIIKCAWNYLHFTAQI